MQKTTQRSSTTKLFYDRYLYRVSIHNSLSSFFRDKNFTYAREQLDKLQTLYDYQQPLRLKWGLRNAEVSLEDFVSAKFLLSEFEKHNDFTLRIQSPTLNLYTNNESWVDFLEQQKLNVYQVTKPCKEDIKNLAANTIIINDLVDYEYKITLKDRIDPNFSIWVKANRDKIKIGEVALENISNNNYVRGFYFYIKNEKILQLCNLMIGGSIARIDKIVSSAVIDK